MEQVCSSIEITQPISSRISVAIADDCRMVRELLIEKINSIGPYIVSVAANNGMELVAQLEKMEQLPQICLMEVNMPVLNGYETQLLLKNRWPEIKSLAISAYDHKDCAAQMYKNGAVGFISKNSSSISIAEGLSAVCTDGYYYAQVLPNQKATTDKLPTLTKREKEYLTLICAGYTMEAIALNMDINIRTVEHYRDNVYRKTQVNSKCELLLYIISTGIVYFN